MGSEFSITPHEFVVGSWSATLYRQVNAVRETPSLSRRAQFLKTYVWVKCCDIISLGPQTERAFQIQKFKSSIFFNILRSKIIKFESTVQ